MSKQIQPSELANIVTALLIDPNKIGEDMTGDSHCRFMTEIAKVVCDFAGGEVTHDTVEFDGKIYISIGPTDSLPSGGGVWGGFDVDGWQSDENDDTCNPMETSIFGEVITATSLSSIEFGLIPIVVEKVVVAQECLKLLPKDALITRKLYESSIFRSCANVLLPGFEFNAWKDFPVSEFIAMDSDRSDNSACLALHAPGSDARLYVKNLRDAVKTPAGAWKFKGEHEVTFHS